MPTVSALRLVKNSARPSLFADHLPVGRELTNNYAIHVEA